MVTPKPECSRPSHPWSLYVDFWNLLLIAIGVSLVLVCKPFLE